MYPRESWEIVPIISGENYEIHHAKKTRLVISFIAGAATDIYLRFKTGDEGNLLVHSVVFLGSFFIVYFLLYILWRLKEKHTN